MELLIITLNISILLFFIFIIFLRFIKSCFLTLNFTNYLAILQYHMEKAYNMVHKDKILVFSLDGLRPREEDVDNIAKEFVNLTIKFLGKKHYKDLVDFYGSDESLLINLFEYFNTKYEDDEIRESTINKLTESEQEELKHE
jgi:hypothetical protein